jgi:hypothetical protein
MCVMNDTITLNGQLISLCHYPTKTGRLEMDEREVLVCKFCRHRIFLSQGRWLLVYKLYSDTEHCDDHETLHEPLGLTEKEYAESLTPDRGSAKF